MDAQQKYEQALLKIKVLEKAINEYQQTSDNLTEITKSLETQIYRIRKDKEGKYIFVFSEGRVAEKYKITTEHIKGKEVKDVIGESLFISTILTPFKQEPDGSIIEISGVTQDINELFETEKKFKEKTEVLNNFIEFNPYSIQICDPNGYQIKYNNAFVKIFKSHPGKNWSLFNDTLLKKMGVDDDIQKVKNGEIIDLPEVWYNSHDLDPQYPDNLRCLRAIHFPIFNIKHELENIIIMHEDITSRASLKKRAKELEEFHELTVGREIVMKNMEEELGELKAKVKDIEN